MYKQLFQMIRQRIFLIIIMIILSISLISFFAVLFGEQRFFARSSYYSLLLIILIPIIVLLVICAVIICFHKELVQAALGMLQWLQTLVLIGTLMVVMVGLNYLKTPIRNVPYIPPGSIALSASGAYVRFEKLCVQVFDDNWHMKNITEEGYIYANDLYDSTCWIVSSVGGSKFGKASFSPSCSTIYIADAICNLAQQKQDSLKWKNVKVSAVITIDSLVDETYGSASICLRYHQNGLGYAFQIGPKFRQIWIMPLNFSAVGKDYYSRKRPIKTGVRYHIIAQVYNGQLRLFVCEEHERIIEHKHLILETYFDDTGKK